MDKASALNTTGAKNQNFENLEALNFCPEEDEGKTEYEVIVSSLVPFYPFGFEIKFRIAYKLI